MHSFKCESSNKSAFDPHTDKTQKSKKYPHSSRNAIPSHNPIGSGRLQVETLALVVWSSADTNYQEFNSIPKAHPLEYVQ